MVTYIAEQIAGVEKPEWGWCLSRHVSDIITPASRRHKDTQQLHLTLQLKDTARHNTDSRVQTRKAGVNKNRFAFTFHDLRTQIDKIVQFQNFVLVIGSFGINGMFLLQAIQAG